MARRSFDDSIGVLRDTKTAVQVAIDQLAIWNRERPGAAPPPPDAARVEDNRVRLAWLGDGGDVFFLWIAARGATWEWPSRKESGGGVLDGLRMLQQMLNGK